MSDIFRRFRNVFTFITACAIAVTISIVIFCPSPQGTLEHIDTTADEHTYHWCYVNPYMGYTGMDTFVLNIRYDDFESSMNRPITRTATCFDAVGLRLADKDDEHIVAIANRVTEMSFGEDEFVKATRALNFVQTAIKYTTDNEQFGHDFILSPVETLYLEKGDCEDKSILLMSIYLAMGYDTVFFEYSDHVAVGVRWNTDMEYLCCETTARTCTAPSKDWEFHDEAPRIRSLDSKLGIMMCLNDGIGWYRYQIGQWVK